MTTVSHTTGVTAGDFHPETRAFFRGRRVMVTGGSGFIGSHVVEQLLELGAEPVVISRQRRPRFLEHLGDRVRLHVADLAHYEPTLRSLDGCSTVIHMAARVAGLEYNSKHPASIFQENLQAFFNAIRAAQEAEVERFCVVSSACVYPRHCSIPTPEHEGFVGEPEPTNSGYGWSKRMEEYLGAKYAEETGMSVAIARPYNAYGPRDNFHPAFSHVIPALIVKAFTSRDGTLPVWGNGSHSRSFLYVDDFARGVIEVAARYAVADAINLGADEETRISELAELIARYTAEITGREIVPVFDASGLTGQPRRRCDTSRAEQELGFRATVSLQDGLRRTIEWFDRYESHTLPAYA